MKRKGEVEHAIPPDNAHKRRSLLDDDTKRKFRSDLFSEPVLDAYTKEYANSQPYKHGVIRDLVEPTLLRKVRNEILENLHFTPKETDIYKIHQSGDLANLDGLDDSSLRLLPSLLILRDALYSSRFRKFISKVANSGPLSGKKTDMAINVYTPTCHLLCHDDVIGSRRLSYILYLTDPEKPWQPEWGGALRLYPTEKQKGKDGEEFDVPQPDFSVSIPPSFNQLSFFTIQPGFSFHDVEEVYPRKEGEESDDGGRVRMAISGWFHIPQEGEEGYEEGLEEKLAANSSLTQLQSKSDEFDHPQPRWRQIEPGDDRNQKDLDFSGTDFEWLIRFINPAYLTPDIVEQLSEQFKETSVAILTDFLSKPFAAKLKAHILSLESSDPATIPPLADADSIVGVAQPPHKQRFLFRQAVPHTPPESASDTPLDQLLEHLLPSQLFARWLAFVTSTSISRGDYMVRRFRRGSDYTLATLYDEPDPQLELSLGLTPTDGWGEEPAEDGDNEITEHDLSAKDDAAAVAMNGAPASNLDPDTRPAAHQNGKSTAAAAATLGIEASSTATATAIDPAAKFVEPSDDVAVGGYEVYMIGDDDDDEDEDDDGEDENGANKPTGTGTASAPGGATTAGPSTSTSTSHTGAGPRKKAKAKADPAVYRGVGDGEDDGAVLHCVNAGWNRLSVVLRDRGLLRFVKYVSRSAKGDRWDVTANYSVVAEAGEEEEEGGE